MGLDIQQMRDGLRLSTGEDTADLPNTTADLYLNRSFWEIMDKFPFREKEYLVTFPTIVGERRYNVPPPYEAVKQLTIVDDYGDHVPLDQIDVQEYEDLYDESQEEWGFPVKYTRENCFVRLWPTPSEIWTLVLRKLITLTDLSNSNSTTTVPQVWHEIIMLGAKWRRHEDLGDLTRAVTLRNLQKAEIASITPTEEKERNLDLSKSRVVYIGREY